MKRTKLTPEKKSFLHHGQRVRETQYGTWQADVVAQSGGRTKRTRRQFPTMSEAMAFVEEQLADAERLGRLYHEHEHERLVDARRAWEHLALHGLGDVTLAEAAAFYAQHNSLKNGAWTVGEAIDKYLGELASPNDGGKAARPRSIRDKCSRLAAFVEMHGDKPIHSVTTRDVEAWLSSTGAEGRNLRNYKTQIQSLFNFCQRHAPGSFVNTVAHFPQRKAVEVEPAPTLTWRQAGAVMAAIEAIDERSAVALALGFFAGVRSDELAPIGGKDGLEWEHIDFESGTIRIPATVAKTRSARDVRITDNLRTWLERYKRESGRISWSYTQLSKHRKAACKAAGVSWGNNLARHSFATYYAKLHGKHAAAEQLGHRGSVDVIEDHYLGSVVKEADAERYFQIVPRESAGIIKFKA